MPQISRRTTLVGLTATGVFSPFIARAATREIRIGLTNTLSSPFGRGAADLAASVASDPLLGNALRITVHPNSELGDDPTMLKACIGGTLDGAVIAGSIISNVVTELGLINAPFLFRDVAGARAAMDGPLGLELQKLARAKDVHVLAWGENGLRQITSNQPVRTPADLRGLKIRVPQSEIMLSGFRALGAAATPLGWSLVRAAIISGEVQAQENSVATIEVSKIYEVQKFLCLTGHIYDPAAFIVSPDLLEDLEPAQRDALVVHARKAGQLTRELCDVADRDGVGRLKAAGVTIVADIDVAAFREAVRPFILGLGPTYGQARIAGLLSANA